MIASVSTFVAAVDVVLVPGDVVALPGDVVVLVPGDVVVLPGDVVQEQADDDAGGVITTGGIIFPTDAGYSLVQLFTARTSSKIAATDLLISKSN
ncbi:hypothetical protein [Spirosoma spitsbergense]|uniref:hypothetical protein n=1 Tax=Spirosoma spitsbergense TaxID=431554 RepID=UPI001FE0CDD5|nr:hypothetical protein [Spirosoma spitsbergense]